MLIVLMILAVLITDAAVVTVVVAPILPTGHAEGAAFEPAGVPVGGAGGRSLRAIFVRLRGRSSSAKVTLLESLRAAGHQMRAQGQPTPTSSSPLG